MNDKWKSLIELVVNEEEDKSKDLFHEIAVDESRKIYENLIDEEDLADVKAALDTIDIDILLISKLEHYRIRNNALQLFGLYLKNRSQYP